MVADAHGNPIYFKITGGEVHDSKVAGELLSKIEGENLIADKGYDSEKIRSEVRQKGMNPVIPKKKNSKKPDETFDKNLYKHRHLVENLFGKLKRNRSIAMRFEKLARNFNSMVAIACSIIWLKL